MAAVVNPALVQYCGLPCVEARLPGGESVRVALQGAQVLSWVAQGRERLYLSPRAQLDGHSAIRGGVPLCFPQFNERGPLPKHGFARNLTWSLMAAGQPPADGTSVTLEFALQDDAATRAIWPHGFELRFTVRLQPGGLQLALAVMNTGAQSLSFTGALHTYLAVQAIEQVRLAGLGGQPESDAVRDVHGTGAEIIAPSGEFDRVYEAAATPLLLSDGASRLQISQSTSLAHTVVWNPGAARCSQLADMPPDGYRQMLCVEAANVFAPVDVQPGARWQGWQELRVA
ncbi:MAG: D-hexose-6-phosphate mutarotase [Burkholderiaceae bacterium]|nr:D-hexose-6-phosphate mutarotase [Burkholderiaceae bacterium]